MPELSSCCGAKVQPLFVRRGLKSRAEGHKYKAAFRHAAHICLQCGKIHIDQEYQTILKIMITRYNNNQVTERDQIPLAAGAEHGQRILTNSTTGLPGES